MSEMQTALRALAGGLPENVIIQNPAGTFSFVGRVAAGLCYTARDGSPVTPAMIATARSFGPRLAGLKVRTWPTREEAEFALAAYADAE